MGRHARFAVGASRGSNRDLLRGMVGERMVERTRQAWIEALEAHNLPCGSIHTIGQVLDDPQLQHRGMRVALSQPNGPLSLLAGPMHVSDTPLRCELPPPLLGQHTDEVLRELLALSDGKPRALRARRVV